MKSKIGKGQVLYFEPDKKRPEIRYDNEDREQRLFMYHNFNRLWFSYDLVEKNEEEINDYLALNLRVYKRRGGEDFEDWFSVLRENVPMSFTSRQRDAFYSWIEKNEPKVSQTSDSKKKKFTIDEIALIHVYKDLSITRENSEEIVKQNGHNSGEKLYQRFIFYSSTANRKGKPHPFTPTRLKNKIKLITGIVSSLSEKEQAKAKDEIKILQTIFDNEIL